MITVANTTYTSARIKYSFDHDAFLLSVAGLGDLCDQEKTLQIDSRILDKAEAETEEVDIDAEESEEGDGNQTKEKKPTKKQQAELLRRTVDTVGKDWRTW